MSDTTGAFDPQRHLMTLKGKEYLEVKWRLVWLRSEHPTAVVETEMIRADDQAAIFRAKVSLHAGGSATGWGAETVQDFADYIEKAETKALGRALAALGYGTQFAGDLGEDVGAPADSPVERRSPRQNNAGGSSSRPATGATAAQITAIYAKAKHEVGWSEAETKAWSVKQWGKLPEDLSKKDASTTLDRFKAGDVERVAPAAEALKTPTPITAAPSSSRGDVRLAQWLVSQGVDSDAHPVFAVVDNWLKREFKGVGIAEFRTAPEDIRESMVKTISLSTTADWMRGKLADHAMRQKA